MLIIYRYGEENIKGPEQKLADVIFVLVAYKISSFDFKFCKFGGLGSSFTNCDSASYLPWFVYNVLITLLMITVNIFRF